MRGIKGKTVCGNSPTTRYINEYTLYDKFVILKISGGKFKAFVILDIADYEIVSTVFWSLMEVGRKGNKKILPCTIKNRKYIYMGRWLLKVTDETKRVEHRNRNCLDYRRNNIYIINKHDFKQQVSLNASGTLGVFPRKLDGKIIGFTVQYIVDSKKKVRYFSAKKLGGLDKARFEAIRFRLELQEQYQNIA